MGKPAHAIKLVGRSSALLAVLSLMAPGCQESNFGGREERLPVSVAKHQQDKQQIIDQCYEDPEAARKQFQQRWRESGKERTTDSSIGARVIWLAVAGCLMELDSENQEQYHAYILEHIRDSEWEVASTAVNALRGSRSPASIDKVISMIGDPREMVSADAVLTIDYIMKVSRYNSSEAAAYNYAIRKMKSVCRTGNAHRLQDVCRENGVSP